MWQEHVFNVYAYEQDWCVWTCLVAYVLFWPANGDRRIDRIFILSWSIHSLRLRSIIRLWFSENDSATKTYSPCSDTKLCLFFQRTYVIHADTCEHMQNCNALQPQMIKQESTRMNARSSTLCRNAYLTISTCNPLDKSSSEKSAQLLCLIFAFCPQQSISSFSFPILKLTLARDCCMSLSQSITTASAQLCVIFSSLPLHVAAYQFTIASSIFLTVFARAFDSVN